MDFVDEVTIEVAAGDGGAGCTAFRREKYNPLGGPSGGDGGDGGDIVFVAHDRLTTLLDLRYKRVIQAKTGERGRGKDQFGKAGSDTFVPVPVGTQIYDADSGLMLTDLNRRDAKYVIAEGGKGGRGNMRFATPQDRAPRRADPGEPGERKRIRMELKLLADVGVVGFPNVGKSTFIAAVSKAKPKIADYPFYNADTQSWRDVIGRRTQLRHRRYSRHHRRRVRRCWLGLAIFCVTSKRKPSVVACHHVLTPTPSATPSPTSTNSSLRWASSTAGLNDRPMVVGVSKTDLPEVQERFAGHRGSDERNAATKSSLSVPRHDKGSKKCSNRSRSN